MIKKIIHVISKMELAGAQILIENLSNYQISNGYEVIIVSLYNLKSPITERLDEKGIKIYYLDKKKGFDFKIMFRLYKIFRLEKPDVVNTHLAVMKYVIPIATLVKTKVKVHTVHNIAEKECSKFHRKLAKIFFNYFNVIPVGISPRVKESIISEYGMKKEFIPLIYNGIDLEKCIKKFNYEFDNKEIILLHVGRFSKQKNHEALIKSFKIINEKYKNSKLWLIGEGELENSIKKMVNELNIEKSVFFLGRQSNVYDFLNKADIFLLPSIYEGMPMVLIEAMATGLPIIASNVGGIPDMIKNNESGLLINGTIDDIAKNTIKLIEDITLRKKIGENAYRAAAQFSVSRMGNKYSLLYKKLYEHNGSKEIECWDI